MSNKEIYAVKSSEGKYLNLFGNWIENLDYATFFAKKAQAKFYADRFNGQAIAVVEEPEKVVLTKEQAEIVERAHGDTWPAKYITDNTDDEYYSERILMEAFVNGYAVEKEKKYKVRVPETQTSYYYKGSDGHVHASDTSGGLDNEFSYSELQQYGLDGAPFMKEEVTDDDE